MKKHISFPINIWDDYYEDGYVPEGEKQETYMYVETDEVTLEQKKNILEHILSYINNNLKLNGVKTSLIFYDSKIKYPTLVGSEYEWCLFERWEVRFENLTHKRLFKLLDELTSANLMVDNTPLNIYSES